MKRATLVLLFLFYSFNLFAPDHLPNNQISLKTTCLVGASCFVAGFITTYFFKDKIAHFIKSEADKNRYSTCHLYLKDDLKRGKMTPRPVYFFPINYLTKIIPNDLSMIIHPPVIINKSFLIPS